MDLDNYKKMRDNPWYFACECIFTQDPADKFEPVKKFPSDLEYLRLFFRVWQKERLLAIPKSRRMFLTWGTLILYLWDCLFHKGREVAFVSKKEENADELLERVKFMLERIPEDKLPKDMVPKWVKTHCFLEFPEIGSKMRAFPSGSDQLRMYAFSGIMADEMAFWDDAKDMYAATFPTIENGGQMTCISSPAPGFFQKLVYDNLDDSDVNTVFEGDSSHKFPFDGLEVWRNPKNKFFVFQIHYTANHHKRDPKYIEGIKASMPIAKFNQEFNLIWESFEGKPVFQDYSSVFHSSKVKTDPWIGLPIIIGVDFGLTPSAIICQLQEEQFICLEEIVEVNMGAERFSEKLSRHLSVHYNHWNDFRKDVLMFIDPAGFQKSQTDERTCAQYLSEKGFSPRPGELRWEPRRTAVEYYLTHRNKSGPCFMIDATRCPVLKRGFEGAYMFPEKAFEIEPDKIRPIKNEVSHVHDALQYACSGIRKHRKSSVASIVKPTYSFSKGINNEPKRTDAIG